MSRHLRKSCGSTVDFVLEGLAEALAQIRGFQYESDEQFYAWISRHIRNHIVDAARWEGRQKRAGRPSPLGTAAGDVESPGPAASTILSTSKIRDAIVEALVDLQVEHPREMEVLVRKLFEEQSWSLIREELLLSSVKRVRTLFARGVDRLRPHVERRLGETALRELFDL